MPWLQVHIGTARDKAEQISDALSAAGALSVTFTDAKDQPIFEPGLGETPLWNATIVLGLFAAGTDPEDLHQLAEQIELAAEAAEQRQNPTRPKGDAPDV